MTQPEPNSERPDPAEAGGWRGVVRRHPVIVGALVSCTLAGIVIGVVVLPEDWALLRRVIGGALGGAGVGLLCTAPRIIG